MLCAVLVSASAPASADSTIFGVGNGSCASAFEPGRLFETKAWIMGFWSGFNGATDMSVGRQTDAAGIIAELQKRCTEDPSARLAQAVYDAYARVRVLKR